MRHIVWLNERIMLCPRGQRAGMWHVRIVSNDAYIPAEIRGWEYERVYAGEMFETRLVF
jgi:hypothetical protein